MKRIFIALKVEPGNALLNMISSLKYALRNDSVKWTDPGNIHITIVFLGDTDERNIQEISHMIGNQCAGTGQFQLILKGTGIFRKLSDPRIIWAGIEPSEKLTQLNRSVVEGLQKLNIRIENRSFNPHLTLGRIKHINDKETLKSAVEGFKNHEFQIVQVTEIILYESILLQTGPVYKPLFKYNLSNLSPES